MHHLSELFMAKQKDWLSFVIENTALILDIRWQLKIKIIIFFKIEHAPFTIIFFGRSTKEA